MDENNEGLLVARVREVLQYEPETGRFLSAEPPHEEIMGTVHGRDGYRTIRVDGKPCPTRRLALVCVNGEWPAQEVGYKDRTLSFPARDRLENLSMTVIDGMVTPEQVRELFDYDPLTGWLTWKTARRGVKVGARAGSIDTNGYRYVPIRKRFYMAQRLAWAHVHGTWPKTVLRFADGDTDNCAIDNLHEGQFDYDTSEGRRAYERDLRQRNPEVFWAQDLWKRFRIRPAQYYAMSAAQGDVCAICGKPESAERNGRIKKLAVDHDHSVEEMRLRDLLCQRCNVMIGHCNDDIAVLRKAIAYLERHAALDKEAAA